MKKWSHLPNAKHIDWVIQSVKDNSRDWTAAWDAARNAAWDAAYSAAWDAARYAAWDAARYAAWDAAWDAAYSAAWDAAYNAAYSAAWDAAYNAASDAVLALVAYDDIEHYLFSSYEELQLIACLSQHPAAILLLPAVKARELIEEKHEQVVTSS